MSKGVEFGEFDAFAALQFGERKLLIPQSDLAILELTSDVEQSEIPGAVGEIEFNDRQWPVFSLTESLELAERIDKASYLCALLHVGDGAVIGLTCEAVSSIDAQALRIVSVPTAMRTPDQLVQCLALNDDQPVWLTSAEKVKSWLKDQEVWFDGDD